MDSRVMLRCQILDIELSCVQGPVKSTPNYFDLLTVQQSEAMSTV